MWLGLVRNGHSRTSPATSAVALADTHAYSKRHPQKAWPWLHKKLDTFLMPFTNEPVK